MKQIFINWPDTEDWLNKNYNIFKKKTGVSKKEYKIFNYELKEKFSLIGPIESGKLKNLIKAKFYKWKSEKK